MKTKLFFSMILCILICSSSIGQADAGEKKLSVITTIFPVYDFSRQIGKEKIDVAMLLPPGVEAHTFSPTPKDIMNISRADVFVYTGKYMEPWAEKILNGIGNKNLLVIDASRNIELSEENHAHEAEHHNDHDSEHEHDAEHHHDNDAEHDHKKDSHKHNDKHKLEKDTEHHQHHNSGKDPHIWLDPVLAQAMVKQIAEGFASKDEANRAFYMNNSSDYIVQLIKLDQENRDALSGCKIKTILYAGHFAFGYFAKRYGLTHLSPYKGFSPDAAPGAKSIAELTEKITELCAKTVYYEELIEPRVAKVIVEKTGVEMVMLHGAHNLAKEDFAKGITYLSIMQDNLKKLKTGLQCP